MEPMEPIEGSETSAFKPQTPGKYPKENILHKEHGESLKSRRYSNFCLRNLLNSNTQTQAGSTSEMSAARHTVTQSKTQNTESILTFWRLNYFFF